MNITGYRTVTITLLLITASLTSCVGSDPVEPSGATTSVATRIARSSAAPPSPIRDLKASIRGGEIRLTWTASTTPGVHYLVQARESNPFIAQDLVYTGQVIATTAMVAGLEAGKRYDFIVWAYHPDSPTDLSAAVTITASPEERFTTERGTTNEIRIYEKSSANGSGLAVDPRAPWDGPANLAMSTNRPDSYLARVQLALYVEPNNMEFTVGPAAGMSFLHYTNRSKFDQHVYTSGRSWTASSFDDWYLDSAMSDYFRRPARTLYTNFYDRSDDKGHGFVVRTGATPDEYRYARVLIIPDTQGRVLRGAGEEQYITVQISYQDAPIKPLLGDSPFDPVREEGTDRTDG